MPKFLVGQFWQMLHLTSFESTMQDWGPGGAITILRHPPGRPPRQSYVLVFGPRQAGFQQASGFSGTVLEILSNET
jgi:hypothetical protein